MENYSFVEQQKQTFSLKKFLKENAVKFIFSIIANMSITALVLWIGGGTRYWLCLSFAFAYSIIKIIFKINSCRKDYLN